MHLYLESEVWRVSVKAMYGCGASKLDTGSQFFCRNVLGDVRYAFCKCRVVNLTVQKQHFVFFLDYPIESYFF